MLHHSGLLCAVVAEDWYRHLRVGMWGVLGLSIPAALVHANPVRAVMADVWCCRKSNPVHAQWAR